MRNIGYNIVGASLYMATGGNFGFVYYEDGKGNKTIVPLGWAGGFEAMAAGTGFGGAVQINIDNQGHTSFYGQGTGGFGNPFKGNSSNNNRSSSGPAYNSPTYTKNSWEKDIYLYDFATPTDIASTWDPATNQRIMGLDPRIQQISTDFINLAESELGVRLRVTTGYRSIKEQNQLYAIGRDAQGRRISGTPYVTNAKGGQSAHNYGLAIDVVPVINGHANYNSNWGPIGELGKDLGFEWGGDWKSPVDKPHFQMY